MPWNHPWRAARPHMPAFVTVRGRLPLPQLQPALPFTPYNLLCRYLRILPSPGTILLTLLGYKHWLFVFDIHVVDDEQPADVLAFI